jgi:uncharacterized protein YaaW (UPF0174 family)
MLSTVQLHPSDKALVELFDRVPAERLQLIYERHRVQPEAGTAELVKRISLDGASTVVSALRKWRGVPYETIVRDVAGKMKVKTDHGESIGSIELSLLEEIVRRYLQNASPQEREQVREILQQAGKEHRLGLAEIARGSLAVGTLAMVVKRIGQHAAAEVVRWVVLRNAAQKVASEAARRATQIAGWAVPVLNVVFVGWTVMDIAGPAFRKTVPTVLEVALLRLEYAGEQLERGTG